MPEGGDGVGVRASLVVDSSGVRASDATLMLTCVKKLDVILSGTAAMMMLDEIFVEVCRIRLAIECRHVNWIKGVAD